MPKAKSKGQTVRERTKQASGKPERRLKIRRKRGSGSATRLRKISGKEYNLPLPKNRLGRLLSKRGRLVPRYFREAWAEIKQVTWPTRQTVRLTTAVFIFALVFGTLVALLDIGLDKIFRELIIKR